MTLLSTSVITDLKKDKIYNAAVIPFMLLGLATGMFSYGLTGLGDSLISMVVTLGILIPVFLIRGIGAGDVKLFVALAAFLPVRGMISCIVCSFFIGACISVAAILAEGTKRKTIHFAVPIFLSGVLYSLGKI